MYSYCVHARHVAACTSNLIQTTGKKTLMYWSYTRDTPQYHRLQKQNEEAPAFVCVCGGGVDTISCVRRTRWLHACTLLGVTGAGKTKRSAHVILHCGTRHCTTQHAVRPMLYRPISTEQTKRKTQGHKHTYHTRTGLHAVQLFQGLPASAVFFYPHNG